MVFPGLNSVWPRYPRWRALARLPRLPCQPLFMLRENSKTRRTLWRVNGKAEDAGLLPQVKDDNAASSMPERPSGMCPLVS